MAIGAGRDGSKHFVFSFLCDAQSAAAISSRINCTNLTTNHTGPQLGKLQSLKYYSKSKRVIAIIFFSRKATKKNNWNVFLIELPLRLGAFEAD